MNTEKADRLIRKQVIKNMKTIKSICIGCEDEIFHQSQLGAAISLDVPNGSKYGLLLCKKCDQSKTLEMAESIRGKIETNIVKYQFPVLSLRDVYCA